MNQTQKWCSIFFVVFGASMMASAAELRVVDSAGLVRAVKVVRDTAKVVVTLRADTPAEFRGECSATNMDGLAAEQKAAVSAKGECVFSNLSSGTWQIAVPQGKGWKAQIQD